MILASTARDIHVVVGWTVIFSNAVAGFWALGAHYREPLRRRELWIFTGFAQVLVTAQAVVGVVIQTQEDLEPPDFHLLYGFTMLAMVMIVFFQNKKIEEASDIYPRSQMVTLQRLNVDSVHPRIET